MAIIYKATCKTTKKSYIGYTTKSLKYRFKTCGNRAHLVRAFEQNCKGKFYSALRKYGWKDFIVTILEKMSYEQANAIESNGKTYIANREIYWISKYNTFYDGYNMTLGGDGLYGEASSIVLKEAWSKRANRSISEETKAKLSKANKGKKRSEETRQRMSEAAKRRPPRTKEHSQKILESRRRNGTLKLSEETRQRMSEAAKRRPPKSEEHRKHLSEALKGNTNGSKRVNTKHTQETKDKISTSLKKHYDLNKEHYE